MNSAEMIGKAAEALAMAEEQAVEIPNLGYPERRAMRQQGVEVWVKIAERWENLAYQVDSLEDNRLRRENADLKRALDQLKGSTSGD